MFKNQPKGLLGAALANMGERFGFYIMMAVLTLFIAAKFGLSETQTGFVYSIFYASIYALALVGGIIADRTHKYKATIMTGLICMAIGYFIIAIPTPTPITHYFYLAITFFGLLVIAFGNGLFKGNLQAIVGQMYDNPQYAPKRDSGFQIFYMFINIGGFFAPFVAVGMRNWWLTHNHFDYNAGLPALCHEYIKQGTTMNPTELAKLQQYADSAVLNGTGANLDTFCASYLDVFSRGFQYAFMAAIVMMIVSFIIFIYNKNKLPDPAAKKVVAQNDDKSVKQDITMTATEIRQRIYALFAVLGVVIFFWFSFHQNGYSLTYFARDYVNLDVIKFDIGFTTIKGAEIFQSINPFFVVVLTPVVMWLFGRMRQQGKEPSTPKKIAIGMGIAAIAYLFILIVSAFLPAKEALSSMSADEISIMKVTPWVMVGLYFFLTVAELFISPLGLSFVSKVAPPHMQGLCQGFWLAATGIGNFILFIGGILYTYVPLWACWLVFAAACAISMIVMLGMVKWLEKIAK
ncbi:MAG: peptide MFS transporter [Lentimicrobiaceae bacterium]|nr:peptide MFS transporter [Lentimicrobiaceae bacterium]